MKVAIVLSGGGSRGAYQIGVWKALKKLRIKYNIVTGTSVGALNGVLMTQKNYKKAYKLWSNMNFNVVFDQNTSNNMNVTDTKKIVKTYAKNIVFEGGMNAVNLYEAIEKLVDEDKVLKSNIDFGLVTVKYPRLKSLSLTKNEIPKGKLKDYLIASASCFPAFQKKEIEKEYYIDGGYYDNLPINLACKMGAEQIIAVDLDAVGLKRKTKYKNVDVKIIKSKHDLGSFLIFDSYLSNKNIFYGYTDTLKEYGKLDGEIFTFKKHQANKIYKKYEHKFFDKLKKILNIENERNSLKKIIKDKTFKKVFDNDKKTLLDTIEKLGVIYEMDDTKIYRISKYNKILLDKINIVEINNINGALKSLKLLEKKKLVKYIYIKINEGSDDLMFLATMFKKEFLCALYIEIIK
ncbi:MAG: patatin-like phospholipase family protein [Bacilli bacterium]|nr:patatin-like phospholipase family protein [Bacilli bacterium]